MEPSKDDENRASNASSGSRRRDAGLERPEDNPFIAFRRYADEHISALLQSIIGLPSAIFPPSSRDWLVFNDEELNELMRNWKRAAEEDLNRTSQGDQYSRGHSDSWAPRGHRYPSHAFPCSVFDSIFDSQLPFGFSPFVYEFSPFRNPFFFDLMSPPVSAGWPMSYILLSPYSPLHLERQQRLIRKDKGEDRSSWTSSLLPTHNDEQANEPRWREAFEDLLRIENDKEMLDHNAMVESKKESGKEWLAGMIERGSLGPGWEHVRRDDGRGDYFKYSYDDRPIRTKSRKPTSRAQDGVATEDGEFTELDLYDAFLRDVNEDDDHVPRSSLLNIILETRERQRKELEELQKRWRTNDRGTRTRDDSLKDFSNSETELDHYERHFDDSSRTGAVVDVETQTLGHSDSPLNPLQVVSTVTTTERRTLPDGTVRTKIVVNKRFADGREDRVETEEISSRDQPQRKMIELSNNGDGIEGISETEANISSDKNKRKGWFWRD